LKQAILKAIAEKQSLIAEKYTKPLLSGLFRQQREFLLSPSKRKLARCTRRAGKSHVIAAYLVYSAYHNYNSNNIYLGLTRDSAKRIMWKTFFELKEKYNLDFDMRESDLTVYFPNRSVIILYGADMLNLTKRLLGNKFDLVVADEAQSFRDLIIKPLMEDVLEPTTMDNEGTICLTGTPHPKLAGYFYEQDQILNEYEKHHWSVYDNIYMPHAKDWVEKKKLEKKWTDTSPTYVREWLGQWAYDLDAMVYKFNRNTNLITQLLEGDCNYICGLDLGWNDATAFVIVGYYENIAKCFVVHSESYSHMLPSEIAKKLEKLQDKYNLIRIVADTGGLGKSIVEEFRQRYELNIVAADKLGKYSHIELLNTDLINGDLSILDCNKQLIEEMNHLTWDDNGKEDPSLPNHLCFSANTKIITSSGYKNINKISLEDKVLTRFGYEKVLISAQTNISDTYFVITNKYIIECTKEHPFFSIDKGLISADSLLYGDKLQEKLCSKSLMGKCIGYLKPKNTIQWVMTERNIGYIEMCGNFIKSLYLMITKYIILMAINIITLLIILHVLVKKNTRLYTQRVEAFQLRSILKTSFLHMKKLKNGTPQERDWNGIKNSIKILWVKIGKKMLNLSAQCADRNIWEIMFVRLLCLCVQINVLLKKEEMKEKITLLNSVNFVKKIIKQISFNQQNSALEFVTIVPASKQIPVYNLKIENHSEYYANNILVSNCDALLYAHHFSRHYWAVKDTIKSEEQEMEEKLDQQFLGEKQW